MSELEKVTAVDTTYDASEIQVLEGLEAVRKRPGMYIGSTSASGLHHLVYEIVDNAIDEALAGYCTEITVTINPGDTITVTDNGRGIPVDIQKQTGRPALEVVYTVLHAGGKFGGGGYKVSGGLHGVGASVVNALSEWLEVQVQKDGRIYEMKFSRGAITQEMKILGDTDQTGTAVTFKPDPEMFDTLVYDYETLHTRMREQAFLNAGLRITITDARPGQEQSDSMCYEGGIREFVTWLNRNKTALHEEVVYLAGAKGDSTAEVALQYNDSYNETLVSFANDIHTPEGGMHETGFKTALTRVLNAYGMKYGMIKEGDKVSGEDVREGITAVISVKLTEAQFEGQTKAKLGNASIRTLVDSVVSDQLAVYLEEHPVVARTILDKALTANRAREAARKARESIRRKTALGGAAMPDKLRDCNENNPELITAPTDEAVLQRWEKLSNYVLKRQKLHVKKARTRLDYPGLVRQVFQLVNTAYSPLYGTVELSEAQIKRYAGKFAPLINPQLTCFVMNEADEMVAFGVAAPSIAEALRKHKGRIFPTGWVDLLKAFRKNDTVDLLLIAVRPDLQSKGVNAVVISQVMRGAFDMGIRWAETGPMLEMNQKVQTQWQDFPLEQHKRRRCFIKDLVPAGQEVRQPDLARV